MHIREEANISYFWIAEVFGFRQIYFLEFFFPEEILQISGIITPWQTFALIMRVLGALFALTR
jgi:hypothetical protein